MIIQMSAARSLLHCGVGSQEVMPENTIELYKYHVKPSTDLSNDKMKLLPERPVVGNKKLTIHSTKVVTDASN